jgi:RHS repeat-associated protein
VPDVFTGRIVAYNLDKAGNRTSITDNVNGNATYAPNNLNQYTSVGGSSVTNGPEHEIRTYNSVTYDYINDEHLKQVTSSTSTYNLYYDALARCVKRTLNGFTTYYIYDGEKPILEYRSGDRANPANNVYGKGIDEILMRYDPTLTQNQTFYYQQDHEGSVTHLVSSSGNVIESYKYDAFGAPAIYDADGNQLSSSAKSNRFLFTGREYANAFGFYEYRARAYHPTLGRFMSEDPKLFDSGDYNLFRYCHNDPIDFTDPMGLADQEQPPGPNHASPLIELSKRQTIFSRSYGAIAEGLSHIRANLQQRVQANKESHPDYKHMKLCAGTVVAAAPIEEAPAALAALGRVISRLFRASEEGTTIRALSTMRVTQPGETFYRYESGNPAFTRITASGGVTPETFVAPVSDGVVPIDLRASTYNLPNPQILRPTVRALGPPPGTAIIGPRSVVGGLGNEAMFPFGY